MPSQGARYTLPWREQVWDSAKSGWAELSNRHWRPVGNHWRYLVERNKIRFTLKPPTPPASGLFYSSSQTIQEPECPELYGDNELLFHSLGAAFLSFVFLPQSCPPPTCQMLEVCHLVTWSWPHARPSKEACVLCSVPSKYRDRDGMSCSSLYPSRITYTY